MFLYIFYTFIIIIQCIKLCYIIHVDELDIVQQIWNRARIQIMDKYIDLHQIDHKYIGQKIVQNSIKSYMLIKKNTNMYVVVCVTILEK